MRNTSSPRLFGHGPQDASRRSIQATPAFRCRPLHATRSVLPEQELAIFLDFAGSLRPCLSPFWSKKGVFRPGKPGKSALEEQEEGVTGIKTRACLRARPSEQRVRKTCNSPPAVP